MLIGCLRAGRLFWVEAGEEPRELSSPYAEQVRSRELQMHRKNAWKTSGTGALFMGQGARNVLWGESDTDLPPARVVGLSRGRDKGEAVYAVSTGVVSGIFAQTVPSSDEQRLFHAADLNLFDLAFSVADEAIVCSVRGKAGSSAIGYFADDGRGVRLVTEGDVVDRAPRFVPGGKRQIVYSSAGIGRTADGGFGGLSPFSIVRLSLDSGEGEVVVASEEHDYLAPVAVAEDVVYAIRRPYRSPNARPSAMKTLADVFIAPFRLLYALLQYLNFFTARYTGRPLITSGSARQKAADARQMQVWGNLVEVSQQADSEAGGDGSATRLAAYELVRITKGAVEKVKSGVIGFDVAEDGTIVLSTGRELVKIVNGSAERVAALEDVTEIAILI